MQIENTSPEIPPAPPVQTQDQAPSPVPSGAVPPPAANLVVNGEVKSERELKLERDLEAAQKGQRDAEFLAAEKERKAQELLEIQSRTPGVKREKRKAHWTETFIGGGEAEE